MNSGPDLRGKLNSYAILEWRPRGAPWNQDL